MREHQSNDKIKMKMKQRAIAIGIAMAIVVTAVLLKVGYVQIVQADWLVEQATQVWNKKSTIEPNRGMILDRNGGRLAYNAKAYTIIAKPREIEDPVNTARKLSPIINMTEQRIYELITKDAGQVELGPGGRKVSEDILNQVKDLELPGIASIEESIRFYPNSAFASHVIGFINAEEKGVAGIELAYDELLKGKEGKRSYITDGKRREVAGGAKNYEPAEDGQNIVLTIDQNIQHFVERALDNAYELYKPKNMTAIVANPQTGEILALANRPHFNLNNILPEDSNSIYQNFAISQFEPGSTFKIITMAAAIEENMLDLSEKVVDNGSIEVSGKKINTWNRTGFGEITYLEALQRSSNVAFVKIGLERLGEVKLFEYIEKFGFGKATGIELLGEMKGNIFSNRKIYPIEVATTSFGQGISVTPLQQIQAVSAVANSGKLIKPTLIKEISRQEGKEKVVSYESKVNVIGRVISEVTAQTMRDAMENVVSSGSGGRSNIDGYRIAGKTGTAQKVVSGGKYSDDKHIGSFIGFAPADNPSLIIYVAVDEPSTSDIYGSIVAAPIFQEIMQDSLHYMGIMAEEESIQSRNLNLVEVDSYTGKYVTESMLLAESKGLKAQVLGNGNYVIKQSVQASEYVSQGTEILLLSGSQDGEPAPGSKIVPDVTGKSKREIIDMLLLLDMKFTFEGEGYAIEQTQQPGEVYDQNNPIHIKFQPSSMPVLNEPKDE